jgi:MFS family permease
VGHCWRCCLPDRHLDLLLRSAFRLSRLSWSTWELVTPESVVPETLTAAGPAHGEAARHGHVLLATCCVVFALSLDPLLWMMGVDIPTRAFGAGWVDYRTFTTTTSVFLVACMLIGGLLGDYFGRRQVLLLASILTAAGGLLTMIAPDPTWLVIVRSMGSATAAIALPLTLALIRLSFVGRDRVRALLIYNLVIGVGLPAASASGPTCVHSASGLRSVSFHRPSEIGRTPACRGLWSAGHLPAPRCAG